MARKRVGLAKISRPRLHDVLARTRLYSLLDKARKRPVVWLSAQPGAGKTTLIASYLEARKLPGLWYQVDAGDVDPATFFYHLGLAAEDISANKDNSPGPLPLLTPEYLPDLRAFARRFFRELFARLEPDAVLVLDNFQEVPDDSPFHLVMTEAMEQIPDAVNVLIASRMEPPVGYASVLAGDAVALLDGEQLRLTLQETRAIARKRGVQSERSVEMFYERCHGWAAGLTLLLARAREQAPPEGDDEAESLQHVFGYFAQRVFDSEPTENQQALMQMAFLPLITVALAEQLTGAGEAGRLLDYLYKRRLFTDRRRVAPPWAQLRAPAQAIHVFQFHALFRAFLQHKARTMYSVDACRDIVSRAGHLLDASGYWEEALGLYAEVGDWAVYGRVMVGQAENLLTQGRLQSVKEWLGRMPRAAREDDPWLGYWEGRALTQTEPDHAIRIMESSYRCCSSPSPSTTPRRPPTINSCINRLSSRRSSIGIPGRT